MVTIIITFHENVGSFPSKSDILLTHPSAVTLSFCGLLCHFLITPTHFLLCSQNKYHGCYNFLPFKIKVCQLGALARISIAVALPEITV